MKQVTVDEARYHAHTQALATQLVSVTLEALEQYGLFSREQNQDIAKDLLYSICTILDGVAHAGELNGNEIAPFVGFYLDHDINNLLVAEDGSSTHMWVNELIDQYHQKKKA